MYPERKKLYNKLAAARNSKVITYVTSDRHNVETMISADVIDLFGNLLDNYAGTERISLFLYTRGGDTLAAWSLVNLLREFCKELEVIIPSKCFSSGTLISLGANRIVMTKQAVLGPIDPSINSPINPPIPGAPQQTRLPVSVEEVAGFIEMAKGEGGLVSEEHISKVFMKLADEVHPIALGKVKRARGQIQDLARKLLSMHMTDESTRDKIIGILCSEAGSHDYSIYRTEAKDSLGLNIETPSMDLYKLIRKIYLDIRAELELDKPFNPVIELQSGNPSYDLTRVIIESQSYGGYRLKKKGVLSSPAPGQFMMQDTFEGWEFIK